MLKLVLVLVARWSNVFTCGSLFCFVPMHEDRHAHVRVGEMTHIHAHSFTQLHGSTGDTKKRSNVLLTRCEVDSKYTWM